MTYLLDTHVLLWFLEVLPELSKKARTILKHPEHELFWSAASYWEWTVKLALGKRQRQKGWQGILERDKNANRMLDLPISERHCERHLTCPEHHGARPR